MTGLGGALILVIWLIGRQWAKPGSVAEAFGLMIAFMGGAALAGDLLHVLVKYG